MMKNTVELAASIIRAIIRKAVSYSEALATI
jgi:hypothetical protein